MRRRKPFPAFILLFITVLTAAAATVTHFREFSFSSQFDLLLNPAGLTTAYQNLRQANDAEQLLQRAWILAQQAGAYDFHTEIEQTTYYAPALTNVGRPAQVDSLYLEGKTDTKTKNFEAAIWQGGSLLNRQRAYEIRSDGQQTYGRQQGAEWQPIEDISAIFAPNRDTLAYLHHIKNVREVPLTTSNFRHFRFELDGPAFAAYMRQQLEDQLRSAGKLPPGITLDTPSLYRGILGEGELWLTGTGLPEQLNFALNFPQQSDGSRVHAVIHTDFANFDLTQLARSEAPFGAVMRKLPLWLANQLGRFTLLDWRQLGMQWTLLLLLGLGALLIVRFGRNPHLVAALNTALIVSIVCTPLIQSAKAAAFEQEQLSTQQEYAETQAQRQQSLNGRTLNWDPSRSPLEAAESAAEKSTLNTQAGGLPQSGQENVVALPAAQAQNKSVTDSDQDGMPDADEPSSCVGKLDCDGDTLTDLQESRLGTALDKPDSDGDKLRDDLEVKGFALGNRQWYADPRNVDSNGDGLPDTLECWNESVTLDLSTAAANLACNRDSDNDGVPDLFEIDNDGDGVDDATDLSSFHYTTQVYSQTTPFTLQSDNLTPNEPLFVDFQMVPVVREQISYARNVLDWPTNDTQGQVVRKKATTFASIQPANSYPPSEENGDLRLVPLVEITMPAADASKILPTTTLLTVTRSAIGYATNLTATQDSNAADQTIWLQASFTLVGNNGNTTITFDKLADPKNAASSVAHVKIFEGACPANDTVAPQMATSAPTPQDGLWSLGAFALPKLLDGKHFIQFESDGDAPQSVCVPLGDVANGALPEGQMFDKAQLDAYGITLRDIDNSAGQPSQVKAYLPANVVTGQTGGEKQAFAARMRYLPAAGVTSLGTAQEVRLLWMVQLLADDGTTQIVHVYQNEAWQLAGLSARQDIALRSAVIYQNPDDDDNTDPDVKAIHAQLWSAVNVLDADFAKGGNSRLQLNNELLPTLESQKHIPAGSLRATINQYETQDELARVPAEVTPAILEQFLSNGSYKAGYDHALLLFAQEEEYKAVRWEGGNTLTLPTTSSTLASYNWKPFRYANSHWESFPAAQYLDLLHVHLQDAAEKADIVKEVSDATERKTVRDGLALVTQAFAMSMLFGANRLVAIDNTPIEVPEEENSLADKLQQVTQNVVGAKLTIIANEMTEDLVQNLIDTSATKSIVDNFEFASDEVLGAVNQRSQRSMLAILGEVAQGRMANFKAAFGHADLETRVGAAGLSISVISIGLVIGKLVSNNEIAGEVIDFTLLTLATVSTTLTVAAETTKVISAVKGAGGLIQAIKAAEPIGRAAKIAAVVGLVLSVGIAVGVFIAQWAAGAFNITDLGFTAALSGIIAAAIVAVLLLAIAAIPIVGPIIVAVIALIDGLIAGVCAISKAAGLDLEEKASLEVPRTGGAKLSFCAGLTGLATEAVRFALFSQTVLVGNITSSDRLKTSNFALNFQNPEQGFEVGNSFSPSLRVDNRISLVDQPFDWKSLVYFWQFNWDNLDNATYRYDLTTDQDERSVSTGEMEAEWQELKDGVLTGSHRSPGIQYDDPLVMLPVTATLPTVETSVPLTSAGINVSVPLYLREAYANPAQECWAIPVIPPTPILPAIPICIIRSDKGTHHIDLQLKYDIFPATLSEFYSAVQVGEGVSLAWGQAGEVKFPAMRDFDGDGLLSSAVGGNDPDDRYWDADHDGLSDLFETQQGTRADLADSDQDGLSDRSERLVGSKPLQSDNDGDGLLDGEEVFHADANGNWVGGWEFVYDIVAGVPQRTWVTSDPLTWNSDSDIFSDAQEKLYGLHPRVVSDPKILKLKSQLIESQAPVTLLRFEERASANVFADASARVNNAICLDDATCPQAGHEGKYTNGLLFDGQDDELKIADALAFTGGSFSVAFWARRAGIDRPDIVFSSVPADSQQRLWMGFGATNRFTCGFSNDAFLDSDPYTDTDWHHWACSYDAQSLQAVLYRDGEVVNQHTMIDAYQAYHVNANWSIGGYHNPAGGFESFAGTIDELVVTPIALNERQIRLLMQGGYNTSASQLLVAPGDLLSVDATLQNNLLGKSLTGLLALDVPANWKSINNLSTFRLAPTQQQVLSGTLSVADNAASGAYSVTVKAGAESTDSDVPQANLQTAPDLQFSFDDPSSRLAFASGQQATQIVGTVNSEQGVIGSGALRLDGKSIVEANNGSLNMSNTSFTYALWVKPDSDASGERALFGQPPDGRDWQYTNSGIFLRIQDGRNLRFGWGTGWDSQFIQNAITPGVWNQVVVAFDQTNLSLYVNGVQVGRYTPPNRPNARSLLSIGDDNYCGQFELKDVYTDDSDESGGAEYVYEFHDELGQVSRLYRDTDADDGEWDPDPNQVFTGVTQVFCRTGAKVHVYEEDGGVGDSDDQMHPDVGFDISTPETTQTYKNPDNSETGIASPDITGAGRVRFYYTIRNPVLPFKGSIDDLRIYRRSLSEQEVQQLYGAATIPYHFTLDDPPGAGLEGTAWFKFANDGAVSDPDALGTCEFCPTSGLPGRVNRAVSFAPDVINGIPDAKGIRIDNLKLPQTAPGFSLWVKPQNQGVFFSLYGNNNSYLSSLAYTTEQRFCIANSAQTVCSSSPTPPGQWTHVMLSFAGTNLTLHLNNREHLNLATTAPAWPGAGTYSVSLGGTGFDGLLDDLRIPFDGQDVAAMLNAAPLVSLHLDETGTSTTAFENVGSSVATCSDNTCPDAGRKGKVAQAAAFDGVDDGLTIPDSAQLDLDHFTLAAWVKPSADTANAGGQPIIAKSEGDFRNYAIYLTNERKIYATRYCSGSALVELTSEKTLPIDHYTHVAATYDGHALTIYINGVRDRSVAVTAAAACQNDAPLMIAQPYKGPAYHYFHGLLDEVLVYANALWPYQVKEIYDIQSNWIEEKDAHTVNVDAGPPTSSVSETLSLATNYYANADVQLGVKAADASSEVTLLELGVSFNGAPVTWIAAEPCEDAAKGESGSPAWCPWFKPSQWGGEGQYQIQTRATDAVGHRESPTASYPIVVDGSGPTLTTEQADGSLQTLIVDPQEVATQLLLLSGTASDPAIGGNTGSGVQRVWVTLRNAQDEVVGDAPYPATLNGEQWSLQYPFYQAQVAGSYTLEVSAKDHVGNQSTLATRTLLLDGASPSMTLSEAASGLAASQASFRFITDTTILKGWLSDAALPPGVRFAYPFDEAANATSFENLVASSGSVTSSLAACEGDSCPTAGVAAHDGLGLEFDGLYDSISLPADVAQSADFSFAAWLYLRGPYPEAEQRLLYAGQDENRYLYFTPHGYLNAPEFVISKDGAQNEQRLRATSALPADKWVHLAFTLQGDRGHIYVDGVEQVAHLYVNGAQQPDDTITINPQEVAGQENWLGRSRVALNGSTIRGFSGKLDQVVIYHRALSGDEVRLLAATQVAGVQSGSLSFTPLWTVEQSMVASPHFARQWEGQSLYLPLDEGSNPVSTTTTYRNLATANAVGATCSGTQCPEAGNRSPAGSAVHFDGQDDFITLPPDVKQSDDFTFAAWVYWRGGGSWQRIFDLGQDTNQYLFLTPSDAVGKARFAITQGGVAGETVLAANSPLPTNQWVHVAVSLVGDTGSLYINGEQQVSGTVTLNPSQIAGNNLWLGRSQYPDPAFNGDMGDVRIFGRGLSAQEIRTLWLGERALLALPVDERQAVDGTTLPDESGWNQPAILRSGTNDPNNKAVSGRQGPYALNFDGQDDYVDLPQAAFQGDDFSFAAWVYWRGGEQWQRILDFGTDEAHNIYLSPNGKDKTLYFHAVHKEISDVWLQTDSALPTDRWVHLAVTLAGDTGRMYVDGKEVTGGTFAVNPSQIVGGSAWLGRSKYPSDPYFNGALDDVRIYARALSGVEIRDLARMGWRQTTLGAGNNWTLDVPAGLEGIYRVDLLSNDQGAHVAYNGLEPALNYTIDSQPPSKSFSRQAVEGGQTKYSFHAVDLYLTEEGLSTPCGASGKISQIYRNASGLAGQQQLVDIVVSCQLAQPPAVETATVCDAAGNCTSIEPTSK